MNVRRAWLIGTLTFGALAGAFVAINVAGAIGQLHALAKAAAAFARPLPPTNDAARSALEDALAVAAVVPPGAAAQTSPLPTADLTPVPILGYRLPERRAGFDADAMRAAIEADPSIGELVNDPDPKVRAAILAFFEND